MPKLPKRPEHRSSFRLPHRFEQRADQVYRALGLTLARAVPRALSSVVPRMASLVLAGSLVLSACAAGAQPPMGRTSFQSADQIFLALRDASRNNDAANAAILGAQLTDYPVPSYVDYFMLKPQLFDGSNHALADAPDGPVLAFLQRYDGLAIADRMRNDYLLVLGARHDWSNFDAQYSRFALNDDTQVKCYALESRAARGENVGDAARALLVDPKNYGDGCVDLINFLAQKQQLSSDDVWQQIRIAYEQNNVNTGNRIADALGADRPDPTVFDQVASAPPIYLARGPGSGKWVQQLGVLAVIRMARNDPALAAATFARVSPSLSNEHREEAWGSIAYLAALKRMPDALDWYRNAKHAKLSTPAYEWRVRTALLAGDWKMVKSAVDDMPTALRSLPAWTYWHARALRETGHEQEAQQEFAQISSQFNFYGQLALEEQGQKISVPPKTVVTDAEVDAVSTLPGFQLSQRFYAMNLRFEGNREWNWTLRNMTDRQLLASAEYARRIQLYDRTVNTADRTQTEHDFSLRYLAPFRDIVQRDAANTGLDVEWAYGLIRQESRFIINAQSGVGATGLMQLMPGTAKLVAKKIGLGALTPDQMANLDTNILLGTNYLSDIYSQLDDSPVLASAGYNAGPGRARQWRDTLTHPVEGAIYAETIPFNETRDYVKNVLSNTTYYAALFEGRPQSLKARLGIITP